MEGRVITAKMIAEFKEHLILEERSVATIKKYKRAPNQPFYRIKCNNLSILVFHSLLESAHSFSSVSISVFIGKFFL